MQDTGAVEPDDDVVLSNEKSSRYSDELTARARTDGHVQIVSLSCGRIEEIQAREAIDRELRERRASGSGTGTVLTALEALTSRTHSSRVAPGPAPDASRVVGGERDNLGRLRRQREPACWGRSEEYGWEKRRIDLGRAIVQDIDRPGGHMSKVPSRNTKNVRGGDRRKQS